MHQVAPRFILIGGCVLSFGASFANVGFLLQTGASVSHLTGDISRFAADLFGEGAFYSRNLILVSAATLGFVFGATASGLLLHHPQLELAKPYGRIISGIGLLFLLSYLVIGYFEALSVGIGGFACGMQNALATKYRGLVLRTTHVTGLLTDLGVMIGMKLRGHRLEGWRIGVPLLLTLSFFAGAFLCGMCVLRFEFPWLLISGGAYIAGGASWSVIKRTVYPIQRSRNQ